MISGVTAKVPFDTVWITSYIDGVTAGGGSHEADIKPRMHFSLFPVKFWLVVFTPGVPTGSNDECVWMKVDRTTEVRFCTQQRHWRRTDPVQSMAWWPDSESVCFPALKSMWLRFSLYVQHRFTISTRPVQTTVLTDFRVNLETNGTK